MTNTSATSSTLIMTTTLPFTCALMDLKRWTWLSKSSTSMSETHLTPTETPLELPLTPRSKPSSHPTTPETHTTQLREMKVSSYLAITKTLRLQLMLTMPR